MDRAAAGARVVGAVVRAAAGDPSAADADPVSGAADGGPALRHRPVGVDVGRCQHQALLGGVEFEDGVGPGDSDRDDHGETDPLRLADLARGRMRRKIPDLAQALTGHFDANHARLARSMLRRLDLVDQALAELDQVIVEACQPWARQIELLQTIPGVGEKVAQVIIAETGGGHVAVSDRRPFGRLSRFGAGDERVRRQTEPGRKTTRQQMADRDAGRSRRIGRPDARQELPGRPARPVDETARDGPSPGRRRALHAWWRPTGC